MILSTHGFVASSIGQFDADAQAFFDRVTTAGGSLSATEKTAINTLVLQMKTDGIWSKMKAIYPMVGASAAACSQNLKSSNFTGTFSSGWTFSSTGVTPNGTSATFNTNFNPVTQSLNVNSNHLAVYLRTINSGQQYVDIGQNNNEWLSAIYWVTTPNTTYIYNPTSAYTINVPNSNALNLSINTRRSSTDFAYFQNNSKIGTDTNSNSASFANANVHIGSAGGSSFYSARQNAFASIGDGLTDTEASNLYTAVQAFQTTLNRQVS